jgi:hypothetical protein
MRSGVRVFFEDVGQVVDELRHSEMRSRDERDLLIDSVFAEVRGLPVVRKNNCDSRENPATAKIRE